MKPIEQMTKKLYDNSCPHGGRLLDPEGVSPAAGLQDQARGHLAWNERRAGNRGKTKHLKTTPVSAGNSLAPSYFAYSSGTNSARLY